MIKPSDYLTIIVYLGFLLVVGWAFGRLNRTSGDFVRGGGKGTWWLVGSSSLLAGISAFTFTGNAAGAYEAGPTLLIIYAANTLAYVAHALFFAARFRHTRAETPADVLRARFGPAVEQFYAYSSLVVAVVMGGAVPLWALATFCSSVFALPQGQTIVILGTVVTLYAIKGGKWSVMGNDFVQTLLVYPITILLAVLCLREVGGFGGFVDLFSRPDLVRDFAWIKPAGQFSEGRYTLSWMIAAFCAQFVSYVNLSVSGRYLAVRDGREAGRAAWLAAAGMAFGALIWFIPPMVTRGLWSAELQTMAVTDHPSASYAFAAIKLLPNGLVGLMVVAMFAATLSTMDVGLNANAGVIIRNVVPPLRRRFGRPAGSDADDILLGRLSTVVLGFVTILVAVKFSQLKDLALFDAFLVVNSLIGLPLLIPMLSGLLFKRLPRWSFFAIFGAALAPAVWSLIDEHLLNHPWTYTARTLWVLGGGALGTFACMPFYAGTNSAYRSQAEAFFARLRTPLTPEEKGEGNDDVQASILGRASLAMAGFTLLLLVLPNPAWGRLCIVLIAASVGSVGALLLRGARLVRKRREATGKSTVNPVTP